MSKISRSVSRRIRVAGSLERGYAVNREGFPAGPLGLRLPAAQIVAELAKRSTPMADRGLAIPVDLRQGAAKRRIEEDRVVAEALVAPRLRRPDEPSIVPSASNTIDVPVRDRQRADEARVAPLHADGPAAVAGWWRTSPAYDAPLKRAECTPGCAIEGGDLQARVLRDRQLAGQTPRSSRAF